MAKLLVALAVVPVYVGSAARSRRNLRAIHTVLTSNASANVSDDTNLVFDLADAVNSSDVCGCSLPVDCTCKASLAYVQCITMKCAGGCGAGVCSVTPYEQHCSNMGDRCGAELSFDCCASGAKCEGKFHQSIDGVAGLTVSTDNTNAFCGPHGKCLGHLNVTASIHRPPQGAWLECVLDKSVPPGDVPGAMFSCSKAVVNGSAGCSFPFSNFSLAAAAEAVGYCWLGAGKHGERLTQNAPFVVKNVHN
eukprot:TRINITY_DN58010_c0_g1_i1.p1 TRINITY_DN58010_c0_g1~~TRINITY_DN58010_c0_g1_i1.p1  ORF type:complete len:249 (-),score=38.56 TRINITY_DN58010_c0_g1_i1:385-1131(-)